jgi:hypothetical protein
VYRIGIEYGMALGVYVLYVCCEKPMEAIGALSTAGAFYKYIVYLEYCTSRITSTVLNWFLGIYIMLKELK